MDEQPNPNTKWWVLLGCVFLICVTVYDIVLTLAEKG